MVTIAELLFWDAENVAVVKVIITVMLLFVVSKMENL